MTLLYPIVLETEDNGAVSAYVPGLPVYAAAETPCKGRTRHSCRADSVPGSAPGQSTRCTSPRGALLRQGENESRYRRRRGPGRRAAQRNEGASLASERPTWRSTSQDRGRDTTTREGVATLSRTAVPKYFYADCPVASGPPAGDPVFVAVRISRHGHAHEDLPTRSARSRPSFVSRSCPSTRDERPSSRLIRRSLGLASWSRCPLLCRCIKHLAGSRDRTSTAGRRRPPERHFASDSCRTTLPSASRKLMRA